MVFKYHNGTKQISKDKVMLSTNLLHWVLPVMSSLDRDVSRYLLSVIGGWMITIKYRFTLLVFILSYVTFHSI